MRFRRLATSRLALTCLHLQVPLTLISEIFNIRYRTISMTICLMWQWLCTFSIVRIMPIALDTITTKTYFLFGGIFLVTVAVKKSRELRLTFLAYTVRSAILLLLYPRDQEAFVSPGVPDLQDLLVDKAQLQSRVH